MSNSISPLQNTLENITINFLPYQLLVRWKNNGVTFSNVFCNGEFEFAIIFRFLWPEIMKFGGGSGRADKLTRGRQK